MVVEGPSILPQRIGRYEVVGHLATGGMAEILLGRLVGPSGFERPVVIKRILPHLARSRRFVDMFLDEARIVARIVHPNVVHVHELGRDAGELFLVMEYLEGESVSGLLRRLWSQKRRLPPEIAAIIVADACAGLHAAHELGVVHRDVSPQNIFVTYEGQVKVIDFGVAKAADSVARTETGTLKGKSSYFAPEQVRGEPIDRRADIFALGCVFFELCTTMRLFDRDNPLLVFKAICEDPVATIAEHRAGFPTMLDAICTRSLERNLDARYPTARQMRRDLLVALRDLGAIEPEQALAELMREIFAERIDEKRELIEHVRDGTTAFSIPDAETDVGVSLPVLAPPRAKRRLPRPLLAGVALGLAGVGVALTSASLGEPPRLSTSFSVPAVDVPDVAPSASSAPLPKPSSGAERPAPAPKALRIAPRIAASATQPAPEPTFAPFD